MTFAWEQDDRSAAAPSAQKPRGRKWPLNVACGAVIVMLLALTFRAGWLVGSDAGLAAKQSAYQQRRVITQPGKPGSIMARAHQSYVMLAGSAQAPSCYIDPSLVTDKEMADLCIAVGQALNMDPLVVQEVILARRDRQFAYVKRLITDAEACAIRELDLRSVKITYEWKREYPCGGLAPSVVGFCYRDGASGGGLERGLESLLKAQDGKRSVLADARRRPIWLEADRSTLPRDGSNVMLCLDTVVQGYLQAAIDEAVEKSEAKWASGVVVDPYTGEVLAMYSAPSFEPDKFGQVPAANRLARSVSAPYEPGSVVKPIFAAAAVDMGRVRFSDMFNCENGLYRARRGGVIRDHHALREPQSLEDVVVKSSNIGMAKLGEKLGNRRIHEICKRFGLGSRTGIELPGESPGIIRPLNRWDGYSLRRVPFGHEMSATTLQIAMAFAALANGGELLRPRLVDHIRSPQGEVTQRSDRQVVRRVLSLEGSRKILGVMKQVVERGTGKACRMDMWTSFGKTGTAQIFGPGGLVPGAYASTFAGGAPASNPRAVCVITVYWPHESRAYYASQVATPYVQKVLYKTMGYLNVPPDKGGAMAMR